MAVSKRLFAYYLLKSSSNNEGHHLVVLSLDIIMDKCSTLASPNCHNFISGSKRFVRHGMGTMDSIMALKNHLGFKYVYGCRFPGNPKTKYLSNKN